MPTYAYVCGNCHHEFDAFQSIKARPLRACPKCGQTTLKRLIGSGAGIIFKGSGFYCTDYRSDGYKNAAKTESGGTGDKTAEKKTPAKADAPAEAKPEAKEPKKKSA
jgi:putative FmdB family regulatory protein